MTATVVIAGPQASGKSTIAAAVADELRRRGSTVALVELDAIAAMALPTLPSWEAATAIAAEVAARWADAKVEYVIVEGVGRAEEVGVVLDAVPAGRARLVVATTISLDIAFARAQADPTRGVSRDREFLARVYAAWDEERRAMDPDLVLDTGLLGLDECVARICEGVGVARG